MRKTERKRLQTPHHRAHSIASHAHQRLTQTKTLLVQQAHANMIAVLRSSALGVLAHMVTET